MHRRISEIPASTKFLDTLSKRSVGLGDRAPVRGNHPATYRMSRVAPSVSGAKTPNTDTEREPLYHQVPETAERYAFARVTDWSFHHVG